METNKYFSFKLGFTKILQCVICLLIVYLLINSYTLKRVILHLKNEIESKNNKLVELENKLSENDYDVYQIKNEMEELGNRVDDLEDNSHYHSYSYNY